MYERSSNVKIRSMRASSQAAQPESWGAVLWFALLSMEGSSEGFGR